MTDALCLNCGEIKFGALSECPKCKAGPIGDQSINSEFSDWALSIDRLKQYGNIIKEIHAHENDSFICYWAFILYISKNDPQILSVSLDPGFKTKLEGLLDQCDFSSKTRTPAKKAQSPCDGENVSEIEKINQLRGEYLKRGPFKLDPYCDRGLFTPEEIKNLEKYGHWFQALAYRRVPILIDSQKRFVKELKKGVEPKGKYARLWYRYMVATEPPF
jgi:hypothetical protein